MQVKPKYTKKQVTEWCPSPRGLQAPGTHKDIPPLIDENVDAKGYAENRQLTQEIVAAFRRIKDPNAKALADRRFVIQWRMFPNANNPDISKGLPEQCGCGCSCGCGCG
jgi:hypothetical protein